MKNHTSCDGNDNWSSRKKHKHCQKNVSSSCRRIQLISSEFDRALARFCKGGRKESFYEGCDGNRGQTTPEFEWLAVGLLFTRGERETRENCEKFRKKEYDLLLKL